MTIMPKAIYRCNAIPIKILTQFFIKLERVILKFIWNKKNPRIVKNFLNNTSRRITIPDLKLYYRMVKPAWHWYNDRELDKWNKIKDPEMNTLLWSLDL